MSQPRISRVPAPHPPRRLSRACLPARVPSAAGDAHAGRAVPGGRAALVGGGGGRVPGGCLQDERQRKQSSGWRSLRRRCCRCSLNLPALSRAPPRPAAHVLRHFCMLFNTERSPLNPPTPCSSTTLLARSHTSRMTPSQVRFNAVQSWGSGVPCRTAVCMPAACPCARPRSQHWGPLAATSASGPHCYTSQATCPWSTI